MKPSCALADITRETPLSVATMEESNRSPKKAGTPGLPGAGGSGSVRIPPATVRNQWRGGGVNLGGGGGETTSAHLANAQGGAEVMEAMEVMVAPQVPG